MEDSLYLQLYKLSPINSEESLDQILTTLWKSRRTGLRFPEKSHFQSLLNLPSLGELDPVLACLRSLIRKTVHENFSGDDLLKLFPLDLALDLQNILVLLLQKYQNQWREEISREQHPLPSTSGTYRLKTSVPNSLPSSETSLPLWPRQDDINGHFNHSDIEISTPEVASQVASNSIQNDANPPENLSILPRLKSMTWTMESCPSAPANRVAIITLKLQDFTRSPSGEMEVKFQLTKDTLEAMLRSMNYISEQLSSMEFVRASSEKTKAVD
ncbi:protein FAR1-RELATED SEQUENCE 3-like isoform X2 [Euphorbia lathyris]|uniref:protein FAR1-RELATED SEQUENCE 3-like isoform X2 n=1 Tax=Euphorbia lathyris TaxID=212925 RepID=UPI003313EEA4